MIESSMSTRTRSVSMPATTGVPADRRPSRREATASSWRMCPKVSSRRNDPKVEGAKGRWKRVPMAPCRTRFRSEMLSAPAIIPATVDPIFRPALAPLSVGTLRCSSASSSSPDCSAKAMIGTSPAYDTRLGSSNRAAATGRVWDSCICEMPFVVAEFDPQDISFFHCDRAFRVYNSPTAATESVCSGLATSRRAAACRRRLRWAIG